MDDKRFRLYVSIIAGLFLLAIGRVVFSVEPIYGLVEPLVTRLDDFASELSLVDTATADENAFLSGQIDELQNENQNLREELGVKLERASVAAEVTRRDLIGFRKSVWVNVGSTDGIEVGQSVVHQGSLFGEVEAVFDNTSRIRTVLDPDFRATVSIDGQQGVLKVRYGSLIADLIPNQVQAGRPVVTDGLDGDIESNLIVGLSDAEVSGESDVFSAYSVLLPYSVFDVRFIDILVEGGEQ